MKKFLVGIAVVLFFTGTASANSGNHYGWYKQHPINNKWDITNTWNTQAQGQSQSQRQTQSQILSNTFNPSVVNTFQVNGAGGSGGGTGTNVSVITETTPDFPMPYLTIPAAPLTYTGTLKESAYATDQMWFKRKKWTAGMVENLPNKGKITDAIFEKPQPVTYMHIKDGRGNRLWCEEPEIKEGKCLPYKAPAESYYLGNVYCESGGAGDKPGLVWGGCSRRLLEKGCSYSVLESAIVNQGVKSNATNQSGGASLAGIFGQLFGFNAGVGASNTDHEATAYEIINMTWGCYGQK